MQCKQGKQKKTQTAQQEKVAKWRMPVGVGHWASRASEPTERARLQNALG